MLSRNELPKNEFDEDDKPMTEESLRSLRMPPKKEDVKKSKQRSTRDFDDSDDEQPVYQQKKKDLKNLKQRGTRDFDDSDDEQPVYPQKNKD